MATRPKRKLRPWAPLLAVAALLANEARAAGTHVIPPRREPIVLRMMCERLDAPLPADCRCDGVRIEQTFIRASYACSGKSDLAIELRHPSDGTESVSSTRQFAVVPRGSLPPALLAAVLLRVQAVEGEWTWASAEGTGVTGGPRESPAGTYPLTLALLAVVALSLSWWAASSAPTRDEGERS